MNKGKKEYKFLWFIEKYSCCGHENGESLMSPDMTFDGLDGTIWYLVLYPKGLNKEDKNGIALYIARSEKGARQSYFFAQLEFSLLAEDGSILHSSSLQGNIGARRLSGFQEFVPRLDVLLRKKAEYLPNDTLCVCCKMSLGQGDILKAEQMSARTRMLTERISLYHTVNNFSTFLDNAEKIVNIQSHEFQKKVMTSNLCYSDGSCQKLIIEIDSSLVKLILHKCELSLVGYNGILIDCGGVDYSYYPERIDAHKIPLSLSREEILRRKEDYLTNDTFILLCNCTFRTKYVNTVMTTRHDLPFSGIKQTNDHDNKTCIPKPEMSGYPSALEDMKAIYISQRLVDIELKTKTKTFPAHKIVLCARSPVFEAMLTMDMKEKNAACIQVDDLEDDIVEQLLLFLYSDSLENLQWESATRLYYAANKYQIGKLKALSSSFLKENLGTSNASQLLVLADTHSDRHLRKVVEDFILKHEEQVYSSNGWEKLKETNPQLALETMGSKYKRKNKVN